MIWLPHLACISSTFLTAVDGVKPSALLLPVSKFTYQVSCKLAPGEPLAIFLIHTPPPRAAIYLIPSALDESIFLFKVHIAARGGEVNFTVPSGKPDRKSTRLNSSHQ